MRFVILVVMAAVMPIGFTSADQVSLSSPVTSFAADALGGIRMVIRYGVARPDRTETDYLLLAAAGSDDAAASLEAIQVQSVHGDTVVLSDVDGADCTLARIALVRVGKDPVIVALVRGDTVKQVLAGSLSGAGVMDVHVYRRRLGGAPGESMPVFTADARVMLTSPVCSAADVERIARMSMSAISQGGGR